MDGLILGILRYAFHSGGGGGGKKMECPITPKAETQKYPYWMAPHFRILWQSTFLGLELPVGITLFSTSKNIGSPLRQNTVIFCPE